MSTHYEFHPVADLFPLMSESALAELAADIKASEQKMPICVFRGKIIDGRNRYLACQRIGVECKAEEWSGNEKDLVAYVVSLNLKRRHLDESQRATVAAKIANMHAGDNQHTNEVRPIGLTSPISQAQAADLLSVSTRSVKRAKVALDHGIPELIKAMEQGNINVSAASKIALKPPEEQKKEMEQPRESKPKKDTVTWKEQQFRRATAQADQSNNNKEHPDAWIEALDPAVAAAVWGVRRVIRSDSWGVKEIRAAWLDVETALKGQMERTDHATTIAE